MVALFMARLRQAQRFRGSNSLTSGGDDLRAVSQEMAAAFVSLEIPLVGRIPFDAGYCGWMGDRHD